MAEHQHTHDQHQDQHRQQRGDDLAGMIELEAEALRGLTDLVTQWVVEAVATPPRHVLDLGCGTGAGAIALLKQFPEARVSAVDSSPQMLARLERLGVELGYSARLTTIRADLDDTLPAIEDVDLVWASSSLHHVTHPDRLLAQVAALLPVDGWFMVAEPDDVPWFLPDDLGIGRPGLERRCHNLLSERRAAALPDFGSDWGARLTSAGLAATSARVFDLEVSAPPPDPAHRFAQALFGKLRVAARERLDAEDLAALDVLLDEADPRGLARRGDLTMRATRKMWAAQRPHDRKGTP